MMNMSKVNKIRERMLLIECRARGNNTLEKDHLWRITPPPVTGKFENTNAL